jgi:hypothetical protein
MIDIMREWFPLVPIVVPILFPILPMICLFVYIMRIGATVERIEDTLEEILVAVQRQN